MTTTSTTLTALLQRMADHYYTALLHSAFAAPLAFARPPAPLTPTAPHRHARLTTYHTRLLLQRETTTLGKQVKEPLQLDLSHHRAVAGPPMGACERRR